MVRISLGESRDGEVAAADFARRAVHAQDNRRGFGRSICTALSAYDTTALESGCRLAVRAPAQHRFFADAHNRNLSRRTTLHSPVVPLKFLGQPYPRLCGESELLAHDQ